MKITQRAAVITLSSEEVDLLAPLLSTAGRKVSDLSVGWLSDHPKIRRYQLLDDVERFVGGGMAYAALSDEERQVARNIYWLKIEAAANIIRDPSALETLKRRSISNIECSRLLGCLAHDLAMHHADDNELVHREVLDELNERRRGLYLALMTDDFQQIRNATFIALDQVTGPRQ